MSPAPSRLRTGARMVATLALGSLVLASCATAKVVRPRLGGTPALSISVPLSRVGCTLNDVCVAVGTTTESTAASTAASAVAEVSTPKGHWFNLILPAAPSPLITSTACSGTQCLLAGSRTNGDLLWRYDTTTKVVTTATPPPGGIGINAVTCHGLSCSLIDRNALGGTPRLSSSADGGLTWSSPLPMNWATSDAITAFSCATPVTCVVAAVSAKRQLVVQSTTDSGVTWTLATTPSSWTALSSLTCFARRCIAIARANGLSLLVRTKNVAATWTSTDLSEQANAVACTTKTSCVVVGQRSNEEAWLATVHGDSTHTVSLRYVPTPLLDVACGSKICSAIGVTTLLSVPLAP